VTCRRPSANDGAWAARHGRCANNTWHHPGDAHASGTGTRTRCSTHQAQACLDVRVRWARWHADAAGREQHARRRTRGAPWIFKHCLTADYSKFFNISGPSDQQQSCRSADPLPLLHRPTVVWINRFCRTCSRTWPKTRLR
jgi:hypothetical protein